MLFVRSIKSTADRVNFVWEIVKYCWISRSSNIPINLTKNANQNKDCWSINFCTGWQHISLSDIKYKRTFRQNNKFTKICITIASSLWLWKVSVLRLFYSLIKFLFTSLITGNFLFFKSFDSRPSLWIYFERWFAYSTLFVV